MRTDLAARILVVFCRFETSDLYGICGILCIGVSRPSCLAVLLYSCLFYQLQTTVFILFTILRALLLELDYFSDLKTQICVVFIALRVLASALHAI